MAESHPDHSHYTKILCDQVSLWIDHGSSLMLKVVVPYGDPLELGENELDELIEVLLEMPKRMDET
jgi:hypothetical protein